MDPKIIERMKRIEELVAKIRSGKFTPAEKTEMEALLKEQMEWSRKNPAQAMEATRTMELLKKTPEQMKAEYEAGMTEAAAKGAKFDPEASAAFRETAAAAGTPESLLPKPVTPPSKFTPEMEQARTDYGKAARAAAIAAGKSVAVADSLALEAYRSWYPEMKDSGFATAPAPVVETPVAAAPVVKPEATAPVAPAPEPEAGRGYGDKTREFEEVMDATRGEGMVTDTSEPTPTPAEPSKEKQKFGDKLSGLYTKFGVPVLEILEAVGKQRGGIDKPTALDKKYQEKLEAKQKEYMENLEKQREEREAAQYEKRIAAERDWQKAQAAEGRAADTAARREELSSREKLLQMQLAAQKGAAATGATIIPK